MTPSTRWKETIAPDEAEKFERYATILADLQRKRGGKMRALHAKQHAGLRARLVVRDDLAEHLRVGPFAAAKTYEAYVRFSNGSSVPAADDKPDVRAVAVKLLDVGGKKLIPGMEDERTQDFLFLNAPSLAFRTVEEFVAFAQAATSPALLPVRLFGKLGFGAFSLLKRLIASAKKTSSLATESYFTVGPIRFGDHAARLSLSPGQTETIEAPKGPDALRNDLLARIAKSPLAWELRAQLFVSEELTSIEDTSRPWSESDSPPVALGRLEIPIQDPTSSEGKELEALVESLAFDPWHACEELRPLGAAMRARSPAYRESQKTRGAAKEPR